MDLRARIKQFEREFEKEHNRKPQSKDIKQNIEIKKLYQQYKSAKKSALQQSPKKNEQNPSDTETDEPTPIAYKVKEVFPTPSIKGKALGLFDVELSPSTPTKPQRNIVSTPQNKTEPETPQSKRTPEYFLQRVNLFPTSSEPVLFPNREMVDQSPLIKRRASRQKSVSDLVKEAVELQSLETSEQNETENIIEENSSGLFSEQLESAPMAPERGGKRVKRQTRRVIMRPVDESQEVSMKKPTFNYQRLKINHPGRNAFKRRRR